MTTNTLLAIPKDLKPRDGRFGSGPSKIRDQQVEALIASSRSLLGTSHRQTPVRNLVEGIRTGLAELFALPPGHEVILGNGGATAFWDIATLGLIEERVAHQVCGAFSLRFAECTTAAPFLAEPIIDRAELGSRPPSRSHAEVDAYAWAQNETSTGVQTPTVRPPGSSTEQLTIVDAVSSAGAMPTDFTQTDAYYFSPQKAFSAEGGMWFAVLSPAAVDRAHRIGKRRDRWIPPFLSLTEAIANSRNNQTNNTPSLSTLVLMDEQVRWMNEQGGLAWAASRSQRSAQLVYDWADAGNHTQPFVATPADRSTVTCVVDIDDAVDARTLAAVLRANGIVDVEPYRTTGTQQLRIATFPSVDPADVQALLACVDWAIERLATC